MSSLFGWHRGAVYAPRQDRLASQVGALASSIGSTTSLLDIGCGTGQLAKRVAEQVGATTVRGVDVHPRAETFIDVTIYDGSRLPFEDASFDLTMVVDVLHHTASPAAVVADALRVTKPGGSLIIKDHYRLGTWSNYVLWAMDVVGNYADGVLVRGNYLSPAEWIRVVTEAGGSIDKVEWPLEVHGLPWSAVARNEYQFLMRVRPNKMV
jgi:SAM-dependent methyltransferase